MKSFRNLILIFAILMVGIAVYFLLVKTKSVPERHAAKERSTVVEVTTAQPSQQHVLVSAMGIVVPAKSVTAIPEVPGRIVYQNPKLIPGGIFKAGEVLIRLDARDYQLAVQQQMASVVQVEAELAKERGLKKVAEREWSLIQDEVKPTEEGMKLALREIQLENAQAMLSSAKSVLEQAQLRLERTVIRAPFNCLVTEEYVDVGQVVSSATMIATLVSSDKFWVRVSVPLDRLSWIHIPGVNSKQGSEVEVIQKAGFNMKSEWKGQVIKLLGNLDPQGNMARLLVEVDQPLGSMGQDGNLIPLLLEAFVNVIIKGPRIDGVFALPRMVLRDQDQLWIKNQNDRLEIRTVEVIWAYQDNVYVRGDLRADEQVITSRIAAPVQNMLVVTNYSPEQLDKVNNDKPANISQKPTTRSENQL